MGRDGTMWQLGDGEATSAKSTCAAVWRCGSGFGIGVELRSGCDMWTRSGCDWVCLCVCVLVAWLGGNDGGDKRRRVT